MGATLGVLEGDGIGTEIVPAALSVLDVCERLTDLSTDRRRLAIGLDGYDRTGSSLPVATVDALGDCDGWLLGPLLVGNFPDDDDGPASPSGALRTTFDLYANVRSVRSYDGVPSAGEIDVTVVRQNTEGFYADRNMAAGTGEFMPTDDLAMSLRVVSRRESRRIAEHAFSIAASRERYERVTAVHKSNVLELGGGLFLAAAAAVADDHPSTAFDDALVDAFAADLVRRPARHDVVVTTNLFGDVLSDEAAGIAGSLGLAPGLNVGDEYAMAQATHGAAPDIAGDGVANPTAVILSTAQLLRWLGTTHSEPGGEESATLIERAVTATLDAGSTLTPDLGGEATTDEFTDAVIARVDERAA